MSRRELLINICPTDYVNTYCHSGCDVCYEYMNKMLDEYDKQIHIDAIEKFANIVLTEMKYGVGGSIEDFIIEYVEQLKEKE